MTDAKTATLGFTPILDEVLNLDRAFLRHHRWFRCRYCNIVYIGKPIQDQAVADEAVACVAHEASCNQRSTDTPLTGQEHGAPAITNEDLTQRVDPALAVDRALNAAERTAFLEFRLVGQYDGAQPSDWLAEADNADAYLDIIEPWWERYGDKALAYMTVLYELPESLTKRLLTSALYATIAITSATLGDEDAPAVGDTARRRTHIEIACGAALWARGYAEALGWTPYHPTRCTSTEQRG